MSEGRVVVTHLGGDAFAIVSGGHRIVVDQPVAAGGDDQGPTPTDLFVGSLAACAGFFAGRFLRRHVPEGTPLRVSCDFEMSTDRPSRVVRIAVSLEVGADLPEDVRAGLVRAVERCTVENSIRQAPVITLAVRALAAVGS